MPAFLELESNFLQSLWSAQDENKHTHTKKTFIKIFFIILKAFMYQKNISDTLNVERKISGRCTFSKKIFALNGELHKSFKVLLRFHILGIFETRQKYVYSG